MLTFEQFLTLASLIGGGIGVLLTYAKAVAPAILKLREKQAEEQAKQRQHARDMQRAQEAEAAKQREHEREMREAKAAAEQSEEVARWNQAVQLQNSLMEQAKLLLDFLINLSTERMDKSDDLVKNVQYELRELRTSISILVNEAGRQEDYRRHLNDIPDYLLKFQSQQLDLYNRFVEYLERNGST